MAKIMMVGLHPDIVDFSQWPDLSPDKIMDGLNKGVAALKAEGHAPSFHLVRDADNAAAPFAAAVEREAPDIIMIGAGVRVPADQTALFEALVNIAHERAPRARFAFNTSPQDSLHAVRRILGAP